MRIWRYRITKLFRDEEQKNLIIPSNIKNQLNYAFTFNQFLDRLYKKHGSSIAVNPLMTINRMLSDSETSCHC